MQQFDVFENPLASARKLYPFMVVLQSDLAESRTTRVVAPLVRHDDAEYSTSRLHPVVVVEGGRFIVQVLGLYSIPLSSAVKPVANLGARRDDLIAALDILFVGV